MFQPELLNNILCQASQQEAPCTTKRTLANPIIPNFYKGRCCIGPGKARQAFFLFVIRMLLYSQFASLTYDIIYLLYFFFPKRSPCLQYFQMERNASESEVVIISLLSCWSKAIMEIMIGLKDFWEEGVRGLWKVAFLTIEKYFLYLVCYSTHLWESKNQAFSILDGLSCEVMNLSLVKMEARIFQYLSPLCSNTGYLDCLCCSFSERIYSAIECVLLIIPLLLDTLNISFCAISEILGKSCKVCSFGQYHM